MIIYRKYLKRNGPVLHQTDGWYLFGFIPLYVRKLEMR